MGTAREIDTIAAFSRLSVALFCLCPFPSALILGVFLFFVLILVVIEIFFFKKLFVNYIGKKMDIVSQQEVQPKLKDEVGIRCQKLFHDFLEEFREDGEVKYLPGAKALSDSARCTLEVSFEDVEKYNQNLATAIIEEFYRVYPFLCQALKNFVKDHGEVKIDSELFVGFIDVPTRHRIRELTSTRIGTLIRISGQVVRTHSVHPELVLGTFKCLDCQTIIKDVEQQFKFTQPTLCRNPSCPNRTRFVLDVDKSSFVDFQKIRIQETQAELPRGAIPRSMEVIIRGESVELVQPGDRYDFTGTLIVVPNVGTISAPGLRADNPGSKENSKEQGVTGFACLGVRELHYNMIFLSCSVTPTNARFGGSGELLMDDMAELTPEIMKKNMTEAEWTKIYEMNQDKNLYNNLISSLFPTIHGCEQVKKGILLMLFGGVPKTTGEGTTLRGDINCCLVGDPSTAKSQMLKLVADMSPRAVYTSGKATSAAGLTAAVVRDDETGEFVIEAGALMLADNGVCCIDEFDKMDPHDQVAIHEAMEQQTISIAKAGVRATLNSRTSILAAANPIYGKYDRTKSLQQNIQLSAPIMSRFDLFFVLIDECIEVIDYAIARKIVSVHSSSNTEEAAVTAYTPEEVLRYITFARQFKPIVSEEAGELLVQYYVQLRQRDGSGRGRLTWRITVRQLESLIRLSEAMAKMECLDEVLARHVLEAFNLLNKSIIRVEQPDINLGEEDEDDTPIVENGVEHQNGETENQKKSKYKLSFEEYKHITNMLVNYMRTGEVADTGISRSDICNWYLEMIAPTIETEEELVEKKGLIEKVLDRLIHQDNILISIRDSQKKAEEEEDEDEDKTLLVVHPNFMSDD